jgi:hypothetical protein
MRKSFTRLFSIIMLFGMILLSAVAFGSNPVITSTGFSPTNPFNNYNGTTGKLIVSLTFDQNVVPGSQHAGIIGLYFNGGQVDPIQISGTTSTNALTGSTAVINNNVVTVTFNRTMAQGDVFNITVSADALMSAALPAGQYFAGLSNAAYPITVGDFTNPVVATTGSPAVPDLTPRDGSSANSLAGNLSATFSENIAKGTGMIGLYTSAGNIVELFDVATSPLVSVVGATLTINPTANLVPFENYYVRIPNTAITDHTSYLEPDGITTRYNNNPFAGINNNTSWNFQAADNTSPEVAFVPVATTNIQKGQVMTMTFSDARTSHGLTFEVRKAGGVNKFLSTDNLQSVTVFEVSTDGGATWTPVNVANYTAKYTATNTVTIAWTAGNDFANTPATPFTKYRIGVLANSFYDEENNPVVAINKEFTAGDFTAPVMVTVAERAGNSIPNGTVNGNGGNNQETTQLFLQSTNTDVSGNDVEVHYLIVANGATAPTPSAVMNGPVLPNVTGSTNIARGFASVDGAGVQLASKTLYDVYFAAKDHATVPNTSTQADVNASKISVLTNDIVTPTPTAKVNTLSTAGVALTSGAASVANVTMSSPVTITFDEPVTAATSNITVKYWDATLATPAWVTLSDGADYTFSFAANTITIAGAHADIVTYPGALWKSLGQYQVIIDNNEIGDIVPAGFGTVNTITTKTYSFTVEDYTGPIAVFRGTTSNNITNVATSANIEVDLGEACTRADGSAIDENNVFFRDVATGNLVPATVTVSGGRYITIDPTANLLDGNAGHQYSIELTASIKDAVNTPLGYYKGGVVLIGAPVPQMLYFTTGDEQRPALSFTPADGTSGLNNNANGMVINVTINETVFKANGNALTASDGNYLRTIVSVVKVSDNSPINFDITNNTPIAFDVDLTRFLPAYAANESYKVTVNGLYDAAHNLITSNSTQFSIREYTKPTITSYSPVDGSTLVAAAAPIKITFSEPVVGVGGQLITLWRDDVPASWTFDAAANTSIAGNVVTLTGVPAFAELGAYHVTFAAGAFVDLVGNTTDNAITTATAWNWSAFDNTAPGLPLTLTPADGATTPVVGATLLAKPSQLVITFTEASNHIVAGPGRIFVREVGNIGIPDFTIPAQSGAVTFTDGTLGTATATIALTSTTFKYNTDYWVEIEPTAFKDAAGNYFAGLVNDNTLWNFKIQADPRPYYLLGQCVPLDNTFDVDLNATVKIKFSEPVWITSPVGKYLTFRNADGTAQSTVYFDSPAGGWSWNPTHDEITVPHPDFLPNSNYYITVTDNTFTDSANQTIVLNDPVGTPGELTGAVGATANLRFSTTDNIAPVVTSITVNGTDVKASLGTTPTGIAKNGDIVITFSEPVTIASADLNSCVQVLVNGVPVTYVGTLVGQVLTINPTADFLQTLSFPGATVDVKTATTNKIKDQATPVANWIATDVAVGKFVVVDYIKPSWDGGAISSVSGNNRLTINSISIDEAGKIYYYAVPAGSLSTTPSPATIKGNNTFANVVAGDNTFDITGLLGDKAYDVYFTAEDLVGNLMDGTTGVLPAGQKVNVLLNVRTLDNVAPLLLTSFNTAPFTAGFAPADNANCVNALTLPVTLQMKFNEPIGSVDASKVWVRKVSNNFSVGTPIVASIAADVVTFTLTGPLEEKTDYYVEIDPSAITDVAGNIWADYIFGNGRWNFTTKDQTAPTFAAVGPLAPANNATGVLVATSNNLVIKFNEDVIKNSAANTFIDIYRVGSATPHERIDVSTNAVQVSGSTVTITRSNIYASEETYYVLIPANSFYDTSCSPNYFAGISLNTTWRFTTQDITAPVVTWNPNGSTIVNSVVQGNTLLMHVNEVLFNGATPRNGDDLKSQFSVVDNHGSVGVTSAIYNSGTGDISIVINPATSSNNTYTVTYSATSTVTDAALNQVPTSSVVFNTEDRVPPVVTITAESVNGASVRLLNNTTETMVGTRFIVSFNKKVIKDGGPDENVAPTASDLLSSNYLTVQDVTGVPVNVSYSVTVIEAGKTYAITPNAVLGSQHNYQLIWTAVSAVKDELFFPNGNVLDGTPGTLANRTFTFTTEDVLDPVAGLFTPVNGAAGLDLNAPMKITFDEKVMPDDLAGPIEIRFGNGQLFAQVMPSSCTFAQTGPFEVTIPHPDFVAFKSYYVVIPNGAIKDVSFNHNTFNGWAQNNLSWTFSTDDGTAPYVIPVVGYNPLQNDQNIVVNSNLVLKFSEDVKLINGKKLVIYYNNGDPGANGNAVEIITLPSLKVTLSGSNPVDSNHDSDILTVNPDMLFDAHGEYYVRIDAGFVQDVTGSNNYAGINDNSTWKFGITDPTLPTLTSTLNPVLGNNVALNVKSSLTNVSMVFDRDVFVGSGFIRLFQYNYTQTPFTETTKQIATVDVSTLAGNINHSTNTVTFDFASTLTEPLLDNTVYYILVDNGAFTNTATSKDWWGGISNPFAWRFTTGDNTAPSVVATTSSQVGLGNNVSSFVATLTFSEAVTGVSATSVTVAGGTMTAPVAVSPSVYTTTITAADLANVVLSMSNAIKDANNNVLNATPITYTIADNNAPLLTATPNGGTIATNVFTVNLAFNEPVAGVDASSISVNNGATKVVSGSGASYQVVVTAQSNSVVTMSFANSIVDMATPTAHPFVGLPLTFNVTGDAIAPAVVELTPADGSGLTPATGIVAKPSFKIKFSEPVVVGNSGTLRIYKQEVSSTNTLVAPALSIDASMISADGLTLTVPSVTALEDNSDYNVIVDAGIVKSLYGVNFAGINLPTDWNFRTGDNTAPILTIVTGDQVNTKNTIPVKLVFTEPVFGVNSSSVVVTGASEVPVITPSTDGKVYDVVIKAADLADVTLTVLNASVTDANGRNTLALPQQTVTYKVGDNTAPTVVSAIGSVVANTITATVTFSEVVTVPEGAITATNITAGSLVVNSVDNITYTITMNAADGAAVSVMVANTITDANGNAFVGGTYGPFMVGDNTAPTVTSVVPASGASNQKNNFTVAVTFDEAVVVPQGAITVTGGAGVVTAPESGNTYLIAIEAVDGAVVTLHISNAVKDASNNLFAGATYTYTVGDNTAPTATVLPVSGTTGLKNTFTVDVTFNEAVTVPEGAISVGNNAVASVKVPVSGNTYTVTITAGDAEVVALNVSSAVKDLAGNSFVAKSYTYTVGDNTAPYVVDGGYSPADGDLNVKGSPISLQLTFNEDVLAGSSSSEVKVYEQTVSNSNKLVFSTSVTAAMISGKVVTIPVTYTLKDNTSYTVLVDNGIVKDASNNVFATGFTDPTRWNFETGDNTAPTVVSVTPATATAAKNSFDVTIEFSEPVVNVNNSTVTVDKGEVVVVPVGTTGKSFKATITAADGDVVTLAIGTGIKDASERNNLAAAVTNIYTIGDNTAPTLVVTAPTAPVAKTFTVGLKFNEAVTGVSATTITVVNGTLNSVTGTGSDYTLSITAEEKAVVGISIPNTIADLSGNTFAGKALEYTVGDFTAPTVSADPTSGENLKGTFSVALTFSADAIVAATDISVTGATKNVITNVGNVYTVAITANDLASVVVSVASTVADAAGNKIAGTTSFTYKVGDNTAPTLVITGPNTPIETSFIVAFKFSESVTGFDKNALTVTNGTVKQVVGSGTDYLASITAAEKAVVTVTVSNSLIVDGNGNKFAGKSATYTVGDFSAPIVTVTPPTTPVATAFTIGLKFDETVSGLYFGGSAVTVSNGKLTDIKGSGDTYTIYVTAKEMTDVTVVLTDAISDLAGNKFAGKTLNYTTGDFTAPELVTWTPTVNDVLANNHPTFKMTFSEDVKVGTGNLVVYKLNTTTPALTIPISDAVISGKNVTLDYSTTNGLDRNARYYVFVDGTALTDIAGNAFVGVSDVAAWTFKTGNQFITEIKPNSSLEFKVYPNPFVDVVNLVSPSQLSKVVVTNIAGQVVKEVVNPTNSIQLNELRSGIYFISLYDMDNVIAKTAKIVKR